ncbi:MAG: sulfatase [Planctomycetota bacterium JB042]
MKKALALFALVVAAAAAVWWARSGRRPPNVVVLAVDTLRADALGCYGAPGDPTPRLDRLAAGGVVFDAAVAAAPWTLPSFASLLTGLYPGAHGAFDVDRRLADDRFTLAEAFAERGYRTAAFTAGGWLKESFGFAQGFEVFDEETETGKFREKIDRAVRWADGDDDRPWFLFLHGYDVHSPYAPATRPPPPAGYEPPGEALADTLVERVEGNRSTTDLPVSDVATAYLTVEPSGGSAALARFRKAYAGWEERFAKPVEELWRRSDDFEDALAWVEANYAAEVRQLDRELGPLLEFLDRDDVRRDTVVVLVSDHGEGFMEHGVCDHELVEEDVVRVPLVVRAPGVRPGRVATPVRGVDLFPTLSALTGAPPPPFAQGRSLLPALLGEELDPEPACSFQHVARAAGGVEASLRLGSWKLVESRRVDGGAALFDLDSAEGETADRKADHPDRFAWMRKALDRIRDQSDRFHRVHESGPGALDAETLEELVELGYLGILPSRSADEDGAGG